MSPLDHNCVHDKLNRVSPTVHTPQTYAVPLVPRGTEEHRRKLGQANGPAEQHSEEHDAKRLPLRVHVDTSRVDADPGHSCFSSYDSHRDQWGKKIPCAYSDVITDEKRNLLKTELIPRAVDFMRKLLSVHRVQGKLRLSSVSCGYEAGVTVPSWMREEGLDDADFVVFVTMRPIESPDTVAYSGHCEVDQTGRPIAAHFNWAPAQMLSAGSEFMKEYLARIAMHELSHSLVFTPELISYFPVGTEALPPSTDATGLGFNFEGYYGHGITYLDTGRDRHTKAHVSTPRVALATRRQFGCDSLRGAQLEDGGGAGTAISHWEMRNFRDEYMVGSSSPGKRYFSAISAALFADSGWYTVNEGMVEPLPWGYKAGCDFLEKSCTEWPEPFMCSRAGATQCSYDRRGEAYCEISHYVDDKTPKNQRYDVGNGFSPLLDYCPVYRTYSSGDCTDDSGYASYLPSGGQQRGPHSRCFMSTSDSYWPSSAQPNCFKTRCLNSSALDVYTGGAWRHCPPDGGKVYNSPLVNDAAGYVLCPTASELCDLDTRLWPTLFSISPSAGPAAGGTVMTLVGVHLDALEAPVVLSFGTAEGVETAATDLRILNATHAVATVPRLAGATSFAHADVTMTDIRGRTAYRFGAYQYDPGWEPYAATGGIVAGIAFLAFWAVPALVRAGCAGTKVIREKAPPDLYVWRRIDPRALEAAKAKMRAASAAQRGGAEGAVSAVVGAVSGVVSGVAGAVSGIAGAAAAGATAGVTAVRSVVPGANGDSTGRGSSSDGKASELV